jgi:hypothetical protein
MRTPEERLKTLEELALKLNSTLSTDIALKGDGTIWVQNHGNDGIRLRKATQQEIITIIYDAIRLGDWMISV